MMAKERLRALEECLELDENSLHESMLLEHLVAWDSRAALNVIALADEKMSLSVTGDQIAECETVGDLAGLLGDQAEPDTSMTRSRAMIKPDEWDEIVLLLDKTGVDRDAAAAEVLRNERKSLYEDFNRRLNSLRFGRFAYFLNYGYIPDDTPTFSVVSLREGEFDAASRRLVLEVIGDTPLGGRDVLDVSCGRGSVAVILQAHFKPRSYLGIDLSEEAVAFCQAHHRREGFEFCAGDAQALPAGEQCFDVVINIEASHNYPDIGAFYRELGRTLRPGGRFLYADLMAPEVFDRHVEHLRDMGFTLLRGVDITSNVLRSCRETAERRLRAYSDPEERAYMAHFLAVPGSQTYRAMEQGLVSYRLYTFLTDRQ